MRTALLIIVILAAAAVGCERHVIHEKSYSAEQFREYAHLPRKEAAPEKRKETGDILQDIGNGVGKFFTDVGKGLNKLNPFAGAGSSEGESTTQTAEIAPR